MATRQPTQTEIQQAEELQRLGLEELAHNLALQWLHKNAHDVWLKGMEGLK